MPIFTVFLLTTNKSLHLRESTHWLVVLRRRSAMKVRLLSLSLGSGLCAMQGCGNAFSCQGGC
jgi:hypothetical protein